jgi:SAM-dependent methyltransferase
MSHSDDKQQVHDFWNEASCGESLNLSGAHPAGFAAQAQLRYDLEPFILDFAQFQEAKGKKVLEIGVGLGADHQKFAEAGADLYGIDLTDRAVSHTRHRLACFGLASSLYLGDAEQLAFADETFDIVYSWGVLHHSPATPKAITEVWRVLKVGGSADHDLSQVEHGGFDVVDTLCVSAPAALYQLGDCLFSSPRKPRHQSVFLR